MHPKDADGIANSVDPDQTAPLGPGSALFPQTCLSENLGKLKKSSMVVRGRLKLTVQHHKTFSVIAEPFS